MGIAYHTLYAPDGVGLNLFDRAIVGTVTAIYPSVGAGSLSSVAVSWTEPVITPYALVMSPIEDCTYYFTNKTALGCTLNVLPRLAANTLSGGSVEIIMQS